MKIVIFLYYSISCLSFYLAFVSKKQAFVIDDKAMKAEYNLYRINLPSDPNTAEEYLEDYFYVNDETREPLVKKDKKGSCKIDKDKLIYHLNNIRKKHDTESFTWNAELEEMVDDYLQQIQYEHDCTYTKLDTEKKDFDSVLYEGPERLTERELLQIWYKPYYTLSEMRRDIDYYSMGVVLSPDVNKIGCSKICCHLKEMYMCMLRPQVQNQSTIFDKIKQNKFLKNSS
jgi:hypothetical protein